MRRIGLLFGVMLLLGGVVAWVNAARAEQSLLLVLQAKPADGETIDAETLASTARVIERRIEGLGIGNPIVKTSGDDLIYALLPGVGEDDAVETTESVVASSTIELVNTNGDFIEPGTIIRTTLDRVDPNASPVAGTIYESIVSGADIEEAYPVTDDTNGTVIVFTLTPDASERFYTYTSEHIGEPLAIVLNKEVLSTPIINAPIKDQGILIGVDEAEVPNLVNQINSGVLTVPLAIVSSTILDDVPEPVVPTAQASPVASPVAEVASPVAVAGCWTADQQVSSDPPRWNAPPAMTIDPDLIYTAEVSTNYGDFTITLDAKNTPVTVNNFVCLARAGYFDGSPFHRVVSGVLIQGGDPTGTGRGYPGYQFDDEAIVGDYQTGAVAMANGGPNTNGSQFFIILADLQGRVAKQYVIFGQVTSGLDVIQEIGQVPVGPSESGEESKPIDPVIVERVTITES
jgi:cyclophilin family peptidyl-prolyl cis-trans isomerase